MSISIITDLSAIKAVALAMSNEETRYYLNCIAVGMNSKGMPCIVATDGHILHMAAVEMVTGDLPYESDKWPLIPREHIERLVSYKLTRQQKQMSDGRVILTINEGKLTATLLNTCNDPIDTIFADKDMLDARYVDVRRVIPSEDKTVTASMVGLNPEYLSIAGKAAAIYCGNTKKQVRGLSLFLGETPNDPVLWKCSRSDVGYPFIGMIMPMRV